MSKTFETILSILDKTAAPILAIEERMKSLGKVGENTQKSLTMRPHEKLWRDLDEMARGTREMFGELGEKFSQVGEQLADVLPMLGGIGAAGSIAGLAEMTHSTAELAENLRNVAATAGMTVPQLQAFEFAARRTGVNTDQLTESFGYLGQRITLAATGQDKRSAGLFKAIGINLRDAHGHLRSVADLLPQIASSFEKTTNPALRDAMAKQLFGGREGLQMIPLLAEGPKGLAEASKKFGQIGFGLTGERQEKLEKFQKSWVDLETSIEGVKNAIGTALAPVFAPLLEEFSKFVAKNRDWIALDIKDVIKQVGDQLSRLDVKKLSDEFRRVLHVTGEVVAHLGGLRTILLGVGAAMTVTFLAPVMRANAQLLIFAFRLGAPIVTAAGSFVLSMGRAALATTSFTGVWDAMGAAFAANPLGAAITAAAALGIAGWELYENWGRVKKFLIGIWEDLGKRFHEIIDPIVHTWHDLVGHGGHTARVAGDESPYQTRFHSFTPHAPGWSPFAGFHPNAGRPAAPQSSAGSTLGRLDVVIHNNTETRVTAGAKSTGISIAPRVNVGSSTLLHDSEYGR